MPSLYGTDDEEQNQGLQGGQTSQGQGPGASAGQSNAQSAHQHDDGFVNFNDLYAANHGTANQMANKATQQVKDAAGGLQGNYAQMVGTSNGMAAKTSQLTAGNRNVQAQPQRKASAATGDAAAQSSSGTKAASVAPASAGRQLSLVNTQNQFDTLYQQVAKPATAKSQIDADAASTAPDADQQALVSTATRSDPTTGTVAGPSGPTKNTQTGQKVVNGQPVQNVATTSRTPATQVGATAPSGPSHPDTDWNALFAGADKNINDLTAQNAAADAKDKAAGAQEQANLDKYNKTEDLLDTYNADKGGGGMQQLLDKSYGPGQADAYDAALAQQAGGRNAFDELNKQYHGATNLWANAYNKNVDQRNKDAKARQDALDKAKGQKSALESAKAATEKADKDASDKAASDKASAEDQAQMAAHHGMRQGLMSDGKTSTADARAGASKEMNDRFNSGELTDGMLDEEYSRGMFHYMSDPSRWGQVNNPDGSMNRQATYDKARQPGMDYRTSQSPMVKFLNDHGYTGDAAQVMLDQFENGALMSDPTAKKFFQMLTFQASDHLGDSYQDPSPDSDWKAAMDYFESWFSDNEYQGDNQGAQ